MDKEKMSMRSSWVERERQLMKVIRERLGNQFAKRGRLG
jgi:hypothetical protein